MQIFTSNSELISELQKKEKKGEINVSIGKLRKFCGSKMYNSTICIALRLLYWCTYVMYAYIIYMIDDSSNYM